MSNEVDLGIDVIYQEPIIDIVSRWRSLVDMEQGFKKPFSMFWVAGPDNKTALAINHIAKQLDVNRGSAIEFEIDPTEWDLTNRLHRLADIVRSTRDNRVMMIARGFEKVLVNTTDSYRLNRAGHDWDQNVLENPRNTRWGKDYSGMDKHVVIITTVGFSAGVEAYEKAVKSAVTSQFKSGILELK